MGRTSTARERLLETTGELMHSRSYASLGVAEICAEAGVKKGSFYHFFESKQALTAAVATSYWQDQRACWTAALAGPEPALSRLQRLLTALTSAQRARKETTGAVDGCLLGNLALELSNTEPDVRACLDQAFAEQTALIAATIEEAAAEGTVPRGRATTATARAVIAQLEGLVLFAKLKNDPTVLDTLWSDTLLLLGARQG
ncbi:TetR/AcrR family transcriptional regulator [Streptomyces sp. NPDC006879]|uniref:TetR/AcrR family transcriptional regulator n=1 Tax=Streptomyces sp. NPDC006879 TaxID=3364767 RepID=UPI00369B75C8